LRAGDCLKRHSRAACPSCTGRRASACAAHLVDEVLLRVPVRQWVLTFPRRPRFALAREPCCAPRSGSAVVHRAAAAAERRDRGAPRLRGAARRPWYGCGMDKLSRPNNPNVRESLFQRVGVGDTTRDRDPLIVELKKELGAFVDALRTGAPRLTSVPPPVDLPAMKVPQKVATWLGERVQGDLELIQRKIKESTLTDVRKHVDFDWSRPNT
jgi:hypothetical protein